MIKKSLVALFLFFSLVSFAQEGTASPYSFYGLGEMRFKGTVDNRSMGGISVIPDSIHINLQNPAFYPYLKQVSLTTGASYSTTKLKTNSDEEKARRTTLDYLAVGIPMGKLSAGFGLMPYTATGYKIQATEHLTDPIQFRQHQYRGDGGVNKAFLGLGYQLTKKFTVGAEFGYYFGEIETTSLLTVYDSTSVVQYSTRELNNSKISGAGYNFGASYTSKVGKKLQFSASAMFSPETKLTASNERILSIVRILTNNQVIIVDSDTIPTSDTKLKMGSRMSFGASLGQPKKWMVGAEMTFIQSENTGNRFNDIQGASFKNGTKLSLGGYFIPKYNAFSDYWKKIVYRGGLKYEETGLVINNKSIKDTGLTLGLGFPLGGTFSNLNFGFEYGKRGTRDAGLVEENYVNFTFGLSLSDRWFVKRKYD